MVRRRHAPRDRPHHRAQERQRAQGGAPVLGRPRGQPRGGGVVLRSAPGHRELVPSNLSDREANPEVKIRVQQGPFWADAQVLDGSDYAETWAGLTADRPWYDDYQSRTDRRIPLGARLVRAPFRLSSGTGARERIMDVSGIIFASIDCDADAVEDWNRWYDLEHLPPNIALPGMHARASAAIALPFRCARGARTGRPVGGLRRRSWRARHRVHAQRHSRAGAGRHDEHSRRARGRRAHVRAREEDRARRRRDDAVMGCRRSRVARRSDRSAAHAAHVDTRGDAPRRRRGRARRGCARGGGRRRCARGARTPFDQRRVARPRPVPARRRPGGGDARGTRRGAVRPRHRDPPRRAVPRDRAVRLHAADCEIRASSLPQKIDGSA